MTIRLIDIDTRIKVIAAQIEAIEEVFENYNESEWELVERENLSTHLRKLKPYTFLKMQEVAWQLREDAWQLREEARQLREEALQLREEEIFMLKYSQKASGTLYI